MHYIKAIISRICSLVHMIGLKMIYINSITFSGISIISNSSRFVVSHKGKINIGKNVGVRRYCEFSASENGKLVLGDNTFYNNGCMIVAHKSITIGEGTRLGPSVMIYDHDYDYKDEKMFQEGKHKTKEIVIGKNCWIGAGTIILRGSVLGDGCIVGAGSVIKGQYGCNQIIIQKREDILNDKKVDG